MSYKELDWVSRTVLYTDYDDVSLFSKKNEGKSKKVAQSSLKMENLYILAFFLQNQRFFMCSCLNFQERSTSSSSADRIALLIQLSSF